ncbi:MAG: hypothetical protein KKG33_06465, partial [candidate division Zixibacteria bacterium]|nr:hypothetical protein [candidate division Zixibacteria bacterium]
KSSESYTIIGGEIFIPEITFYGRHHKSRNGSYLIAWGESIEDSSERIVLFKDRELLMNKRLKNIRHARVSDRGLFILDTWSESGGGVSQFLAMDRYGRTVVRESICSSVVGLGLSDDGYYAAFQTGYSENVHDSAMLIFIDIEKTKVLWRIPSTDWAVAYSFDPKERQLQLSLRSRSSLAYGFDGTLLTQGVTAR